MKSVVENVNVKQSEEKTENLKEQDVINFLYHHNLIAFQLP